MSMPRPKRSTAEARRRREKLPGKSGVQAQLDEIQQKSPRAAVVIINVTPLETGLPVNEYLIWIRKARSCEAATNPANAGPPRSRRER
jgi:hypothetical protein